MKRWGRALLGVAVTIALLWWSLSGVSISEVWASVRRGDPLLLGAAVLVATSGFVIRAMRWRIFLLPVHPGTTLRARFAAVAIHFMANNILPLRVGEFARALVFSRLEPVKASAAFGTVVVERFMDGFVLLVFLVLPVLSPEFPDIGVLTEGLGGLVLKAAAIGVIVVLAGLVALAFFPARLTRLAERIAPVLPRAIGDPLVLSLESFLDSVAIMRNPRLLAIGFAWSFGFWAFHAVSFWLGMKAFGIETGYVSALFTSSVVAFGVALPSAPGFIGTFHFAANFALTDVYGVSAPRSLAFAFGYHFGGWVPITVIGLYYVWRLGLSLGEVGSAEDRLEEGIARP